MNYEEFANKFVEVACEKEGEYLSIKTAIETAWQAFGRLLVEQGLQVTKADPIQGDYDGSTDPKLD